MLNCSEDYDYRNGLRKITDVIHFLFILPGVYEGVCVCTGGLIEMSMPMDCTQELQLLKVSSLSNTNLSES